MSEFEVKAKLAEPAQHFGGDGVTVEVRNGHIVARDTTFPEDL